MCKVHPELQRHRLERFAPRTALVDALAGDAAPGLVVLAAPAGYGKTWLLGQVGLAWARDAMPVHTWRIQRSTTEAQALRALYEAVCGERPRAGQDPVMAADAMLAAIRERASKPAALIIDVDGPPPAKAMQSRIAQIVDQLASCWRVRVACRNPWLLPADRLSVRVPLRLYRAADLAMTAAEIAQVHGLETGLAEDWRRITEGWPLICGESAHGWLPTDAQAQDREIDRLVGTFGDYFEHELLEPLAARDIKLLMRVSVVEAVEPGMLEALDLGATWSRLSGLMESGLPLSGVQADWDRIVLHPVFQRFLQRRMLAHAPVPMRALHRRAAHYFAATGRCREAMLHAQQTSDPVLEAQITESSGGWRISWREGLQALTPGAAPPAELAARFPKAALARIYWQAQTGRIQDACAALERLRIQQPSLEQSHDLRAIEAVVAIYRDEDFDESHLQQLAGVCQESLEDEPLMLPGGDTLQAALLNNAGLYDRASQAARAAIVEAEALGSHYVEYYGQLQHALAQHGLGRAGSAVPGYFRARELAQELFGENSSEYRVIGLLIAHAAWLAGQDEQAERAAGELGGLFRLHTWFEPYARVLQIAQVMGRRRGGRALEDRVLDEFAALAERRALPRLKALVCVARARQAFADGQIETAERCCDEAIGMAELLGERAAARVMATAWLEKTRLALARTAFDAAAQALAAFEHWNAGLTDGALAVEGGLVAAYLALRERRYREAAQRFSQSVLDAERTGLRRPFLDNAGLVGELVGYARDHAVGLEPGVLRRAAGFAGDAAEGGGAAEVPRLAAGAVRGGLLLTQRETDILHCLSEGLSSKEMARRLAITEATVKTHRKHLYEKLGVGLRSQVIVKARDLGLL